MTHDTYFSAELFDNVPVGIIAITPASEIVAVNKFGKSQFGLNVGQKLNRVIHTDSLALFEESLQVSEKDFQIQLKRQNATFHISLRCHDIPQSKEKILILRDISEQVALGSQLSKNKQPERKFIHAIGNALTTIMGYSELITMMLGEHESIAGERREAVLRYQKEVYTGLQRVEKLIKQQKKGKQLPSPVTVPLNRKHVMVVDDEPSIAEFLAVLMRGRQYKVTAFTDSLQALEFYKSNKDHIDLVIMDQIMPELSGISLATELLSFNIDLPIVLCTGDQELISEQSNGRVRIKHFIRKPIDISELTEMVSTIID